MPKIVDYPRASLRAALQLADAVDGFAGSCSAELAAEKLGKKISGAFAAQISATAKYGLIDVKGGKLSTTQLYRNYKLAYTPEESAQCLQEALLSPPLFNSIYTRFKGQKLPIAHFEKMLIREFDVPDDAASRVSNYFLEGAKMTGTLNNDNVLVSGAEQQNGSAKEGELSGEIAVPVVDAPPEEKSDTGFQDGGQRSLAAVLPPTDDFWLNIRGPGMNFSIEISESDDLEIVQVMLRKIEKALKNREVSG